MGFLSELQHINCLTYFSIIIFRSHIFIMAYILGELGQLFVRTSIFRTFSAGFPAYSNSNAPVYS